MSLSFQQRYLDSRKDLIFYNLGQLPKHMWKHQTAVTYQCSAQNLHLLNSKLRLGAQSFTSLNTLRDPTQSRQRQWATRQQHLFFGCPFLSSLEQLISAPNHEWKG